MKIEKIACNKVKVTVYPEDLTLHGLSFESFSANSPRVQNFFWNIIQKAENEADFEIEDGKVIIEAVSMKNDGLVIFLTKPDGLALVEHKMRRVRYRIKQPAKASKSCDNRIYRFDSFDDICAFTKLCQHIDIRSNLYVHEDAYFLIPFFDSTPALRRAAEAQLLEFARPVQDLTEAYLEEHAHKICDGDAISAIRRYF